MSDDLEARELKPCPFCGGEAYFREGHVNHWTVCCCTCGAKSSHTFARYEGKARAAQEWNTRALEPRPAAPDEREAVELAYAVLNGQGDGTYDEATRAIEGLLALRPTGSDRWEEVGHLVYEASGQLSHDPFTRQNPPLLAGDLKYGYAAVPVYRRALTPPVRPNEGSGE